MLDDKEMATGFPAGAEQPEREEPTDNPVPCFVCGKTLKQVFISASDVPHEVKQHGYVPAQPTDATMFETTGHYGSDHFDSFFDGKMGELAVCSACIDTHPERIRVIRVNHKKEDLGSLAEYQEQCKSRRKGEDSPS